jgi:hypothetical protein
MDIGSAISREVLVSLFVIGVVGTGLTLTTVGAFTDADQSGANAVEGGTMDLKLDGGDTADGVFGVSSGLPGDTTSHRYSLTSDGSANGDSVEINLSVSENDGGASEPADSDLAAELDAQETASLIRVVAFQYENGTGTVLTDIKSSATDDNGNGIIDLQDLQNVLPESGLAPPSDHSGETELYVELSLADDDSADFEEGNHTAGSLTGSDEDLMADGVDVTVTVKLTQSSN